MLVRQQRDSHVIAQYSNVAIRKDRRCRSVIVDHVGGNEKAKEEEEEHKNKMSSTGSFKVVSVRAVVTAEDDHR